MASASFLEPSESLNLLIANFVGICVDRADFAKTSTLDNQSYGLLSRKSPGTFGTRSVTDFVAPSSVTASRLGAQLGGVESVVVCCSTKSLVVVDGHETVKSGPARRTESAGRSGR